MNRPPYIERENSLMRPAVALLATFFSLASTGNPSRLDGQDLKESPGKTLEETGKKTPSVIIQSITGTSGQALTKNALTFSGQGEPLILKAGADPHKVEDLLFLDFLTEGGNRKPRTLAESAEVVLSNGDHFWATPIGIEPIKEDDFLVAASGIISQETGQRPGQLRLDLTALRLLLYRNAFTSEVQWSRFRNGLLKASPKNDVAHMSAGTRLTGFLEELKRSSVLFSADGVGKVKLATSKLRALELASIQEKAPEKTEKKKPGQMVVVFLRDGGKLQGELRNIGEDSIRLTHEILGSISMPLSELAQVTFLGGRCQYLSDVKPAKTREHLGSLFLARLPFKQDSNVLGNPLKMRGKVYRKGLGVHAYSRLDYDLSGGFQKFQATIGLDDSARPVSAPGTAPSTGTVVFRILLDGKLLEEKPMSFSDRPLDLDLDIAGGSLLSLEVDFGGKDSNAALDRANWCGARVIK